MKDEAEAMTEGHRPVSLSSSTSVKNCYTVVYCSITILVFKSMDTTEIKKNDRNSR